MQVLQYTTETQELKPLKLRAAANTDDHIVRPVKRWLPKDIAAPVFEDLVALSLLRVVDAARPSMNRPPRLFATSETVFGRGFSREDWFKHGDLETEVARMRYMLSEVPERGTPTACFGLICLVLSSRWVLEAWKETLCELRTKIEEEVDWMVQQMQGQQDEDIVPEGGKPNYLAIPVDYRTDSSARCITALLWERSLAEIASQATQDDFSNAREFVQIFSFLKDPLGGLASVSDRAVELFVYTIRSLLSAGLHLSKAQRHAAVAQAAQEALFLAIPLLENVEYVHFTGHQQLPYAYVELDHLTRSEFSISKHVLRIIEEILTADAQQPDGSCHVAPITVASYPSLPLSEGKLQTVIIDGNHRASATMVLRLIAEQPSASPTRPSSKSLECFCTTHGLGTKWKVDLAEVFEALCGSHCENLILSKMDLVRRFREVETIPCLIVREDHFHTACQQRPALANRPRMLLPIHQAIYNDTKLNFAFPQAGQVHGRTTGFRAMPLLR